MVRSPGGSPVNAGPSTNTIDSRTVSSSASRWTARRASGGRPSSKSSLTHSQLHSATRDLVVGRLDDLGRFLDGPLPALSGVQARGHRRPALNRDSGPPALIEVPDREDAVFVAGLAESLLDFLEELGQSRGHDGRHRLPQRIEGQRGHGNQRLATLYVLR